MRRLRIVRGSVQEVVEYTKAEFLERLGLPPDYGVQVWSSKARPDTVWMCKGDIAPFEDFVELDGEQE